MASGAGSEPASWDDGDVDDDGSNKRARREPAHDRDESGAVQPVERGPDGLARTTADQGRPDVAASATSAGPWAPPAASLPAIPREGTHGATAAGYDESVAQDAGPSHAGVPPGPVHPATLAAATSASSVAALGRSSAPPLPQSMSVIAEVKAKAAAWATTHAGAVGPSPRPQPPLPPPLSGPQPPQGWPLQPPQASQLLPTQPPQPQRAGSSFQGPPPWLAPPLPHAGLHLQSASPADRGLEAAIAAANAALGPAGPAASLGSFGVGPAATNEIRITVGAERRVGGGRPRGSARAPAQGAPFRIAGTGPDASATSGRTAATAGPRPVGRPTIPVRALPSVIPEEAVAGASSTHEQAATAPAPPPLGRPMIALRPPLFAKTEKFMPVPLPAPAVPWKMPPGQMLPPQVRSSASGDAAGVTANGVASASHSSGSPAALSRSPPPTVTVYPTAADVFGASKQRASPAPSSSVSPAHPPSQRSAAAEQAAVAPAIRSTTSTGRPSTNQPVASIGPPPNQPIMVAAPPTSPPIAVPAPPPSHPIAVPTPPATPTDPPSTDAPPGPPEPAAPATVAPPKKALVRVVNSHGGHSVDQLVDSTAAIRPRPAVVLGHLDYEALAPSLRSGLLMQGSWALNSLVVATGVDSLVIPPVLAGRAPELALALVEHFWGNVNALAALPPVVHGSVGPARSVQDPTAWPSGSAADACPQLHRLGEIDTAEIEEEGQLDVHRQRRELLTEHLESVALILRNWTLTAAFRPLLASDAAVVTVWMYSIAADLRSVPARSRRKLRSLAWEAVTNLGQLLRVPGPSLVAEGAPSALGVLVAACTDGLTAQADAIRIGVTLTELDAAETRSYIDVATTLTLVQNQELARCPIADLRALVLAAVGIVQPLLSGTAVRAQVQSWAKATYDWGVEAVLLLVLNLIQLPVSQAVVRTHGPIARALLNSVFAPFVLMLATRGPAPSPNGGGYGDAQRLALRIVRELAVLPEAYSFLMPYETTLIVIATAPVSRGSTGLATIPALAVDVLHALATTAATATDAMGLSLVQP